MQPYFAYYMMLFGLGHAYNFEAVHRVLAFDAVPSGFILMKFLQRPYHVRVRGMFKKSSIDFLFFFTYTQFERQI